MTDKAMTVAMLMVYNSIVVICTFLGVLYISGWMFCLLMAVMKFSDEDKK